MLSNKSKAFIKTKVVDNGGEMKPKIVIIGANDFQNQLILKAKEKGYETHVFAWKCGDVGEKSADYFYPISIVDKEQILAACKKIRPEGIISIASDLASITVNYVAEKLGLVGNGMESAILSTNKHKMRKAFEQNGIPSPKSIQIEGIQNLKALSLSYPLIVKPTDRSGSRGIYKIDTPDSLEFAIHRALEESFEKKVLIEEFAEGQEYSIECISHNGKHHFLAITQKYTTGAPNFIETGHFEPAFLTKAIEKEVFSIVERALNVLKIKNGASHSEIKIDQNGKTKVIEIGGRMGGDCIGSDLVKLSTGYDFVSMVIDIACNKEFVFPSIHLTRFAFIRFIFNKNDLKIMEVLQTKYPEMFFRISNMEEPCNEHMIQDSSQRLGYYILVTEDKDKLTEAVNYIYDTN